MNVDIEHNHVTLDSYDKNTAAVFDHEEAVTIIEGTVVRKRYRATIERVESDHVVQIDIDDENLNFDAPDQELDDDTKSIPQLPRAIASELAKQQTKGKLNAALATFGHLPKLPKEAANDNFRPLVSWPLMDQLKRSTFEPNLDRRSKFIVTARYVRDLIDLSEADPLGNASDSDVQGTEDGRVYFDHGQSLDRKKRTADGLFLIDDDEIGNREAMSVHCDILESHNKTISGQTVQVVTRARLKQISLCRNGAAGDDAFGFLVDTTITPKPVAGSRSVKFQTYNAMYRVSRKVREIKASKASVLALAERIAVLDDPLAQPVVWSMSTGESNRRTTARYEQLAADVRRRLCIG
jgi:hypothetical protein